MGFRRSAFLSCQFLSLCAQEYVPINVFRNNIRSASCSHECRFYLGVGRGLRRASALPVSIRSPKRCAQSCCTSFERSASMWKFTGGGRLFSGVTMQVNLPAACHGRGCPCDSPSEVKPLFIEEILGGAGTKELHQTNERFLAVELCGESRGWGGVEIESKLEASHHGHVRAYGRTKAGSINITDLHHK
jgi:hypothetical protein